MNQVQQAVEALKSGGVIAYPTEAVYGLGCDPHNEAAIMRLLEMKQRDVAKGLILIAASYEQLQPYLLELDAVAEARVLNSWPGPHTWIIPSKKNVSRMIRGNFDSLAVRVTDHPLVRELCEKYGGAIISTSANRASEPPARTADEVYDIFGDEIDFVLAGDTGGLNKPTEIRDAISNEIIRSV